MEINEKKLKEIIKKVLTEAIDDNDNVKFKPTVQWMEENYNKANAELFGGTLGDCEFKAYPFGVRTLGWFKITGKNIKANRRTGRMYRINGFYLGETLINSDNFVSICQPVIEMNTNYSATQKALYCTLVHEMCHYYTYKDGHCPRQGHGTEFRRIGEIVSYRSNGLITIKRLASAEDMADRELDSDLQQKVDAKKEKQMNDAHYIIVKDKLSPKCELLNTNDAKLIEFIISHAKRKDYEVLSLTNKQLSNELYNSGYKNKMRTYRFWAVDKKDEIMGKILSDNINYDILYSPDDKLIAESDDNDDAISITPNMNLGKYSPLELI